MLQENIDSAQCISSRSVNFSQWHPSMHNYFLSFSRLLASQRLLPASAFSPKYRVVTHIKANIPSNAVGCLYFYRVAIRRYDPRNGYIVVRNYTSPDLSFWPFIAIDTRRHSFVAWNARREGRNSSIGSIDRTARVIKL